MVKIGTIGFNRLSNRGVSAMGLGNFLQSARRLFHVAQKPDWQETKLNIKIILLGVAIVGGIGFVLRVLFWVVGLYQLPASQAASGSTTGP